MFDVNCCRKQFPSLNRFIDGQPVTYFDGPGGTQVPQRVIDAVSHYFGHCNANHGGTFATSRESDVILAEAHAALADFLNAPSADEIIFGANMTTLTFHFTRAIARTLRPDDEIMVTELDHDANVSPWVLAARDAGATVRTVRIHPEDCTIDLDDYRRKLSAKTRWVAVAGASNAVGTINDVKKLTRLAHAAGAKVFVDAVHYAPHGPIDVQDWDCDVLACSAYKFFGPHIGVLLGKRGLLEALPTYKVRPAPDGLPGRWMTGTQNHEGIAGTAAAIEYLLDIGTRHPLAIPSPNLQGRRLHLRAAMTAIQSYEATLSDRLLQALADRPRFKVWGVTDRQRLTQRVPTISIAGSDHSATEIAEHLAAHRFFVWNGNMYALALSERLGLEKRGGFLRIGMVHYNTMEEVERLVRSLDELS